MPTMAPARCSSLFLHRSAASALHKLSALSVLLLMFQQYRLPWMCMRSAIGCVPCIWLFVAASASCSHDVMLAQALPEPTLWDQAKAYVTRKPVRQVQVPLARTLAPSHPTCCHCAACAV